MYFGGLIGWKSENVENVFVVNHFLVSINTKNTRLQAVVGGLIGLEMENVEKVFVLKSMLLAIRRTNPMVFCGLIRCGERFHWTGRVARRGVGEGQVLPLDRRI